MLLAETRHDMHDLTYVLNLAAMRVKTGALFSSHPVVLVRDDRSLDQGTAVERERMKKQRHVGIFGSQANRIC